MFERVYEWFLKYSSYRNCYRWGEIGTSHFPAKDIFSVSNWNIITKRQKVQNPGVNVKKVKMLLVSKKAELLRREKAFLEGKLLKSKKTINFAVLRIRDVYPGSRILIFTHPGSRIPDLGSRIQKQQQKRGVKKIFVVIPFLVAINFT